MGKANDSVNQPEKGVGSTKKEFIVGRYEIVHTFQGGMGVVHLCRDHLENRLVALKIFKPEFLSHVGARDLFLREGTMWVKIGRHPHIVRAHRVERVSDGLEVYLVLNWVLQPPGKDNPSLRAWLKPGEPLPIKAAIMFALHIARGMKHAAKQIPQLVHRDLKPENILVGHDGNARVTDFGLASTLNEMNLGKTVTSLPNSRDNFGRTQLTQGIAGTPLYMAPEQWQHQELDERADIYALGCIFYEMVTGRLAAEGEKREQLRDIHLNGRIKPPSPSTHPAVVAFLRQCMSLNREQRYRSWTQTEDALLRMYWSVLGEKPPAEIITEEDTPEERLATGFSYDALGLSYMDIGKLSVAVMYFEQAIWVARQERSLELEGQAIGNLGSAYIALGYIARAIEFFREHQALARELSNLSEEGRALGNLGRAHRILGDPIKATIYHERQLAIAQGLGDRFKEASAYYNLGDTFRALKKQEVAVNYYKRSLAIAKQAGDRIRVKSVLSSMGHIYLDSGEAKLAAALFHQSLEMARSFADKVGEGQAFGDLGFLYKRLGYEDRAIEFYNYALDIALESHDWRNQARDMVSLGDIYFEKEEYPKAKEYYEGALNAVQEVSDQTNIMILHDKLGHTASLSGEYMEAATLHRRALAYARDLNNNKIEQNSLIHLGEAYEGWGDAGRAADYYREYLELVEEREDWRGEIFGHRILGKLYHRMHQNGLAREAYEKCLEIAQSRENMDEIIEAYISLGELWQSLGDDRQASEQFKEAINLAHQNNLTMAESRAVGLLAGAYQKIGRKWQATRHADKSLKLARQSKDEKSLMWANYWVGFILYEQEKFSKVRPFIETAEELFNKYKIQDKVMETQRIRADLDHREYGT